MPSTNIFSHSSSTIKLLIESLIGQSDEKSFKRLVITWRKKSWRICVANGRNVKAALSHWKSHRERFPCQSALQAVKLLRLIIRANEIPTRPRRLHTLILLLLFCFILSSILCELVKRRGVKSHAALKLPIRCNDSRNLSSHDTFLRS